MYERPYEQTETDLREKVDVLLSLKEIPDFLREICRQKKIMWIDIEKKEQPNYWNDLGEEVTMFLKRYGVRLSRV